MKMRFRTDGWHYADMKSRGWSFDGEGPKCYGSCFSDPAEREDARKCWDSIPKAEHGDVWRVRWYSQQGEGPIAGYAICCPGCGKVHCWSTASNCNQKTQHTYKDKDGKDVPYTSCAHSGVGSCWQWSGSAEDGSLTASPSLLVQQDDCKWHGWLTNGDLRQC